LAVYLAQLGRSVVLIDSDGTAASLHRMLGLDLPVPEEAPDPFDTGPLEPIKTPVPGLSLVPQQYTQNSTMPLRPGRRPRWAKGLRMLDADYILIDLGPGTAPASLDLFLGADFGICPISPDPPSIESTYNFLKALFQRQVRRLLLKDRYRMRLVERALGSLPPLPRPIDMIRALGKYDQATAKTAASHLAALRAYLVTNGTRLRHDVELGGIVCDLAERYLGVHLGSLGHIEHDDAIWLSVVRRRPLLLDNPTSKSAKNVERIARRVVALATTKDNSERRPVPTDSEQQRSLYDVLWTHRGASDEELRRAYKRQREIFQPGSLPLTSLLTEEHVVRDRSRIEEAQETLLDPVRRRAYDLSYFPDADEEASQKSPRLGEALRAEQEMLKKQLAHEIHAETEYTGDLLRRVRESQGVELQEIARKTKISTSHLHAIEEEDFGSLPAEVYTRGFVQQLSMHLGLDSTQATRTYVRRYKAYKKAQANLNG
jgi:flagellar biosynthesis protein FlhG